MLADINMLSAWVGFALGVLSGAVAGLFFHAEQWWGGYGSWRRRMVRLGHIAFFGLGLLNLAFALTVAQMHWSRPPEMAAISLAAATLLMPMACFLAAWKKPLRHLFVIPVLCVICGIGGIFLGRQ